MLADFALEGERRGLPTERAIFAALSKSSITPSSKIVERCSIR
jgi:hypothetical protein